MLCCVVFGAALFAKVLKSSSIWLVLLNSVSRRHILHFCKKKLNFDPLQDFPLKQAVSTRTSLFTTKMTRKRDFKHSLQKISKVAPFG